MTTAASTFEHEAYLKNLAPNIPLRYRIPAFCLNCDEPIMPPCANYGLTFCRDCRATPEYRTLFAR